MVCQGPSQVTTVPLAEQSAVGTTVVTAPVRVIVTVYPWVWLKPWFSTYTTTPPPVGATSPTYGPCTTRSVFGRTSVCTVAACLVVRSVTVIGYFCGYPP